MPNLKSLAIFLLCILLLYGCDYIVLPEEEGASQIDVSKGWSGHVTNVSASDTGALRIDLTIRNETGAWSTMQAAAKPAILVHADGKTSSCDTTFVNSGGHRLAPGFQMRGYTTGTTADPRVQTISVECGDTQAAAGDKLKLDYIYYTGEYNYYEADANKATGSMELSLDAPETGQTYPVAHAIEGLALKPGAEIVALNNVVLKLTGIERTDKGLEFQWQTANPGEYPSYVHIGKPPVIGSDGIIYGKYASPDLESVPVTGAGQEAEWTTNVAVPPDVSDLYILLSVESKKQRLFVNYALDLAKE